MHIVYADPNGGPTTWMNNHFWIFVIFCKLGDTVDTFGALRGGQRDQNCKMHYLMLPRDYVIREYLKEHHGGAQKASMEPSLQQLVDLRFALSPRGKDVEKRGAIYKSFRDHMINLFVTTGQAQGSFLENFPTCADKIEMKQLEK